MRIATWNINGVKARIDGLVTWLGETRPDAVCLQEIKSVEEGFPFEPIMDAGYHAAVFGQKGFNGVAILSRTPFEDVARSFYADPDPSQARYIEAVIAGHKGALRLASIYLPNGNPIGTDKFTYKLAWMAALERHLAQRLVHEEPLVAAGDYNVIPTPLDARTPTAWNEDALYQPASRAAFRRLVAVGFTDAVRTCNPEAGQYTFWDYQAGAWNKDNGIRIDHLLLSPQAADRLAGAGIDRFTRGWERPSDHVPAWIELDL